MKGKTVLIQKNPRLKSHPRDKYLGSISCKILGNIPNKEMGRLQKKKKLERWYLCSRQYFREIADRLCVLRKERGRALANIKDCVAGIVQGLEDKNKNSKKWLIIATNISSSNLSTDQKTRIAQSAGAVEYTDCFSAER